MSNQLVTLEMIYSKVSGIDAKVVSLDNKLISLDKKVDHLETKIDDNHADFLAFKKETRDNFREMYKSIKEIPQIIANYSNGIEERISRLEQQRA